MSLQWRQVDFERELLLLPDSKTGAKPVYLNEPAIDLLKQIPHVDGNPYVIVGKREGANSKGINKVWERIRRSAGVEDVRLHDLRHSFASVGAGASIALQAIGKLLGHSSTAVTERYAHLQADPVRHAAGVIGARIASAMELP